MPSTFIRKQLKDIILQNSIEQTDWRKACAEWDVVEYHRRLNATCLCGQPNIVHCFTVRNRYNHISLQPIGSECINKFGHKYLIDQMSQYQTMYAIAQQFQSFTSYNEIKKLLNHKNFIQFLYENDVFDSNNEYEFFQKMLRKRTDPSEKQEKWMKHIIYFKIKPFILHIMQDSLQEIQN